MNWPHQLFQILKTSIVWISFMVFWLLNKIIIIIPHFHVGAGFHCFPNILTTARHWSKVHSYIASWMSGNWTFEEFKMYVCHFQLWWLYRTIQAFLLMTNPCVKIINSNYFPKAVVKACANTLISHHFIKVSTGLILII